MQKEITRWLSLVIISFLFSCKVSHPAITFDTVKSGKELDRIPLVTHDIFLQKWAQNRIQKVALNVYKLYRDSVFTYFGENKIRFLSLEPTFFKVENEKLISLFPNYSEFDGYHLLSHLWENVIPKEDLDTWRSAKCSRTKNRLQYKYSLVDQNVILNATWNVKCKELIKLKGKEYQATYNLMAKQIER